MPKGGPLHEIRPQLSNTSIYLYFIVNISLQSNKSSLSTNLPPESHAQHQEEAPRRNRSPPQPPSRPEEGLQPTRQQRKDPLAREPADLEHLGVRLDDDGRVNKSVCRINGERTLIPESHTRRCITSTNCSPIWTRFLRLFSSGGLRTVELILLLERCTFPRISLLMAMCSYQPWTRCSRMMNFEMFNCLYSRQIVTLSVSPGLYFTVSVLGILQ